MLNMRASGKGAGFRCVTGVRSRVRALALPLEEMRALLGLLVGRGFIVLAHLEVHSRFRLAVRVDFMLWSGGIWESHSRS